MTLVLVTLLSEEAPGPVFRQVSQPCSGPQREVVGDVPLRQHVLYLLHVLPPKLLLGLLLRRTHPGGVPRKLRLEDPKLEELQEFK